MTPSESETIHHWKSHPEIEYLDAIHVDEPPVGMFEAELCDRAWGELSNLMLFFSVRDFSKWHGPNDPERNFMLSVWSNDGYRPRQDGPCFKTAPVGHLYMLVVRQTKNETYSLDYAKQLSSDAPPPQSLMAKLLGRR